MKITHLTINPFAVYRLWEDYQKRKFEAKREAIRKRLFEVIDQMEEEEKLKGEK